MPKLRLTDMMALGKEEIKVDLTKNVCSRARKWAVNQIRGNVKKEFNRLYDYVFALREADPTGTFELVVERPTPNDTPIFKSKEVIEILTGSSVALDGSSLVSAIVELLLRNWIVRCCHVFRESNMVADKLASVRCSYSSVATEWSTPPPPLVDLVHKEMSNC
ncbi:hypothetical protein V6N12_055537 [Hibiscus sabdariffa]|uniref:RNase H type-1 domain-containing protein n=1 Tax=Hibiscus sabdariffa TaxID=183260 RepID=A0ABR2BVD5_9ROSI